MSWSFIVKLHVGMYKYKQSCKKHKLSKYIYEAHAYSQWTWNIKVCLKLVWHIKNHEYIYVRKTSDLLFYFYLITIILSQHFVTHGAFTGKPRWNWHSGTWEKTGCRTESDFKSPNETWLKINILTLYDAPLKT